MGREIAAGRACGLSTLVARHGRIAYCERFGAVKPGGPAMPADAIFRIYSMTKPIVCVAAMTLVEEGRLLLSDPLAKYLPAFAETKVGVERDGALELVPAKRPITIHDLMRHASGLTYGFAGGSAVHRLVAAADIVNLSKPTAEQIDRLAKLPLLRQPGEAWEYGLSTDVLGRVLEVVSGKSLGAFVAERVLRPLEMVDTAFFTPPAKRDRLAEPLFLPCARGGGSRPHRPERAASLRDGRDRARLDDRRLRALPRHGRVAESFEPLLDGNCSPPTITSSTAAFPRLLPRPPGNRGADAAVSLHRADRPSRVEHLSHRTTQDVSRGLAIALNHHEALSDAMAYAQIVLAAEQASTDLELIRNRPVASSPA